MYQSVKLSLLICALGTASLAAQTVISHDLIVGDDTQLHNLYTTSGFQFLGLTRFIHDDTVGFQIRNTEEVQRFLLNEITYLGLAEESFVSTTEPDLLPEARREIDYLEEYPLPNNQLLYSSTALPYRSRGVYRNTMLLVNQIDYQFSDYFVVGGGTLIPALVSGRFKAHLSASDILHLGLAVQYNAYFFDSQSSIHPYAIVTVGRQERYLNFTMGYWIDRFSYSGNNSYPMVTLGASFAFAPGWRFYVDGAAVFGLNNSFVYPSFHFANQRRKGALEFGIMALPEADFPVLPLLTYNRIF